MAIKLGDITGQRKRVSGTFDGESFDLEVKTNLITPAWIAAYDAAKSASGFGTLADVITKWDIVDADGEPLPINYDTVMSLPLQLAAEIFQAIVMSVKPSKVSSSD